MLQRRIIFFPSLYCTKLQVVEGLCIIQTKKILETSFPFSSFQVMGKCEKLNIILTFRTLQFIFQREPVPAFINKETQIIGCQWYSILRTEIVDIWQCFLDLSVSLEENKCRITDIDSWYFSVLEHVLLGLIWMNKCKQTDCLWDQRYPLSKQREQDRGTSNM